MAESRFDDDDSGSSGASTTAAAPPVSLAGAVNDHGTKVATNDMEVELDDFCFGPTYLRATAGQQLSIELFSFTIDSLQLDQQLAPEVRMKMSITAPASGLLELYCRFHKGSGMQRAIFVGKPGPAGHVMYFPRQSGRGEAESEKVDEADEGGRRRVEVPVLLEGAAAWGWRILVVIATSALLVFVFLQLYVVVVPVILALFLAAVLEPFTARLRARGWPRALAATTVFFVALLVLVGVLFWIGASVAHQFTDVGEQFAAGIEDIKEWAQGDPLNLSAQRVDELETDIREMSRTAVGGVAEQAAGQARVAGEVLGGLVLLLFTLFFVLKDGSRIADWLRERIPPDLVDDAVAVTLKSRGVMRQYLIATAATGLIDGVFIGIALWVLGVPLVIPLAVLTALGGFVPIVGATVAGLIAAVVALVANGVGSALLVVAATIAVQQIEGNLLQPLILERAVKLHPLLTVWAVAAGLVVGGLLGAFLSVPLLAIAVGFGSHYRNRGRTDAGAADGKPEVAPAG